MIIKKHCLVCEPCQKLNTSQTFNSLYFEIKKWTPEKNVKTILKLNNVVLLCKKDAEEMMVNADTDQTAQVTALAVCLSSRFTLFAQTCLSENLRGPSLWSFQEVFFVHIA